MFFESQRVMNKNLKYAKSKAYGIINTALERGLTYEEIVYANELALKHSNLNETQESILNIALKIARHNMEKLDEVTFSDDGHLDDRMQHPKPNTTEK